MTDAEKQALADIKAKVAELMDDMKVHANECIDRLQASGADIAGDHIDNAGKCWLTPRNFMAAFAKEIEIQVGQTYARDTKSRKQIIKNYERMM